MEEKTKQEVTFSEELDVKINILGREELFDNLVCYNDKEKKVKLTQH